MSASQLEELEALISQMKIQAQKSSKAKDEIKPLWQRTTPQERAEEILKWSTQKPQTGISLPDEAFDRGTIYD